VRDQGVFSRPLDFIHRHTLWAGFVGVLLPLVVLFGLQFTWLKRLQETTAIARRAALNNYLEAIGSEVQYYYRSAAERALNVPVEALTSGHTEQIGLLWKQKPVKGAARLFLVDFTQETYGAYRNFDEATGTLAIAPASDETMAMIAAMLSIRQRQSEGGALNVDERNPDYRFICNPILDASSGVVGVAGMVLDVNFFRTTLLPSIIKKALPDFFSYNTEGDIEVFVKDGAGRVVFGVEDPPGKAEVVTSRFPFVFTDWTLVLHSHRSTPERWARANFAINVTLAAVLALFLVSGIVLALRAADRAMRLSQMKSDFVSNVSHELRTPLASIRVFAELLRLGRVQAPEKVREYGEQIERESRRLSRLIENILDFSRIESGRKTYHFAPTDMRALVEGTLQSFEMYLKHSGFSVRVDLPAAPLPPLFADADALSQALHNLLDNAVKFSGEARVIGVRLAREGEEIVLSVEDHGVGIPPGEQRKIFDRFHRVSTGLVHEVKGSGLGLSLVHHILQVHGGRVTVQSEPGRGSVFALRLPIRESSPSREGD
jgi:signal transduction histidine kinase